MMSHWMFNCKEVTRLVSESLDHDLPFYQRVGVKMHLLMCKFCSESKRQMLLLRRLMKTWAREEQDEAPCLPSVAKERIKRSLKQK